MYVQCASNVRPMRVQCASNVCSVHVQYTFIVSPPKWRTRAGESISVARVIALACREECVVLVFREQLRHFTSEALVRMRA